MYTVLCILGPKISDHEKGWGGGGGGGSVLHRQLHQRAMLYVLPSILASIAHSQMQN